MTPLSHLHVCSCHVINKDIQSIHWRFGNSVTSYFEFFQAIFLNSLAVCLIFTIQTSVHLGTLGLSGKVQKVTGGVTVESVDVNWGIFNSFIPTWLLYESYGKGENLSYAACLVAAMLFLVLSTARRLINEDEKLKVSEWEQSEP